MQNKALLMLIALSTAASVTACAAGKSRQLPPAKRYTVCKAYPEIKAAICNTTGDSKDDFTILFDDMKDFFCYPNEDHIRLMQELDLLRNGHGRRGDIQDEG